MRPIFISLFHDEQGAAATIELVLLATITIVGLITGLAAYRDAVAQELGDAAAGVASLQQTYSLDGVGLHGAFGSVPYDAANKGSSFSDQHDFCEQDPIDPSGSAPMCMEITSATVVNEDDHVIEPTGG